MATLDSIADEIGFTRNELMQSMVKFGLTNRDWRNEGLTAHKRLPRYQENPDMATKTPSAAQLAARARFAEMARNGSLNRKRQIAAKKRAANPVKKTVSQKISQLVHEGYPQKQAVAVALNEQRAGKVKRNPTSGMVNGYAIVCMHPEPHTVAITMSMYEAKQIAQDYATRENVQVAIKPIKVHAAHFA
jgi:hypothetical protein